MFAAAEAYERDMGRFWDEVTARFTRRQFR